MTPHSRHRSLHHDLALLGRRAWRSAAVVAVVWAAANPAHANVCGALEFHYGPFDYRTHQAKLPIVEGAHFTASVANLQRGRTAVAIGGDLSYTLQAFPNHPRALDTVVRHVQRTGTATPRDLPWPAECYFERAIRFRPDDTTVRLIYAQFLVNQKRPEEARTQLRWVLDNPEGSAIALQFAGLYLVDLQDWDMAREAASKAKALGIEPPLLIDRLRAAGQWSEPGAAVGASSAPAAGAASAAR
jgi:uncharacterized protein (TIGR02996 family)